MWLCFISATLSALGGIEFVYIQSPSSWVIMSLSCQNAFLSQEIKSALVYRI